MAEPQAKYTTGRKSSLVERFKGEFRQLAQNDQTLTIELTPIEAWCLLSQVQLASRHPHNVGLVREIAERGARKLQTLVARSPALFEVAEQGWNPACDEEM